MRLYGSIFLDWKSILEKRKKKKKAVDDTLKTQRGESSRHATTAPSFQIPCYICFFEYLARERSKEKKINKKKKSNGSAISSGFLSFLFSQDWPLVASGFTEGKEIVSCRQAARSLFSSFVNPAAHSCYFGNPNGIPD